jgi:uncharacterized lipoprotein YmbA
MTTIKPGSDDLSKAAFAKAQRSLTEVWAAAIGKDLPSELVSQLYKLTKCFTDLANELNQPRSEELDAVVKLLTPSVSAFAAQMMNDLRETAKGR